MNSLALVAAFATNTTRFWPSHAPVFSVELVVAAAADISTQKELMELLNDDARRRNAVEGLHNGNHSEASDDCNLLLNYLYQELYKGVFSEWKKSIDKSRVRTKNAILEQIDSSDEAICLLVLEVKAKELISLVEESRTASEKCQEAERAIQLWKKENKDEPIPQELLDRKEEANKAVLDAKKKGRKSKKRTKKRKAAEGQVDGQESELQELEQQPLRGDVTELANHEARYKILCKRINLARKEEEGKRWYEEAWRIVMEHENLHHETTGGSVGPGSAAGSASTEGESDLFIHRFMQEMAGEEPEGGAVRKDPYEDVANWSESFAV